MNQNVKRDVSINRLVSPSVHPLLIAGTGFLGTAFSRLCEARGIPYRALSRLDMDITQASSVATALRTLRPWAVVNAAGYSRIDDAESDEARCYAENAHGAGVLATACARSGIGFLTFSSDMVFGEENVGPRVETDPPSPCSVYGASKVKAERRVRRAHPSALMIRPGPIFGPWDEADELTRALRMLAIGAPVSMPSDEVASPTYVPDLVNESLDLLLDGERGIWHLANRGEASPYDLVTRAAAVAGISTASLRVVLGHSLHRPVRRPASRVLSSQRGEHLPLLDDALARYVAARPVSATLTEVEAAASAV